MKRLCGLALVVVLAGSCTTTGTTPGASTAVTVAKDCADQATHVAAINIIGDVATALASDSWTSALTDLVTRWGIAAVDCAVQEVAGEANHNAQASGDKLSSLKATRGRQWLTAHPIGVDGGSP